MALAPAAPPKVGGLQVPVTVITVFAGIVAAVQGWPRVMLDRSPVARVDDAQQMAGQILNFVSAFIDQHQRM